MGTDAELHFSTKEKLTDKQIDILGRQFVIAFSNNDYAPIKYQKYDNGYEEIYGRLYTYKPHREHVYSLCLPDRHTWKIWVKVYAYIKLLNNHPWVDVVYYGPDNVDDLKEATEEMIKSHWDDFIEYSLEDATEAAEEKKEN